MEFRAQKVLKVKKVIFRFEVKKYKFLLNRSRKNRGQHSKECIIDYNCLHQLDISCYLCYSYVDNKILSSLTIIIAWEVAKKVIFLMTVPLKGGGG